jgi:hypothetical protein
MAVDMSERLLREFGATRQPFTHLLIRWRSLRSAVRSLERKLAPPPTLTLRHQARLSDQLEDKAEAFRAEGWAFLDAFYESRFFDELRATWPGRRFFAPMHNPLKSYDFGFRWQRARASAPIAHIERFPALEAAYNLFRSPEFAARVERFCNDGITRSCFSLTATWATARSALIPHRDTIARDGSGGSFINLIVFIDANGQAPHAGGTCIIADNEYRKVIFEPTELTNTALVYRSNAEFFHGFRPMAPGTFRWTINAQYSDVNWKAGGSAHEAL